MRKIFLFLFAAVLSIGTASAITVTVVDDYWSQSTFTGVTYDESTYTWSQEYAVGETVTIGIDEAGADMYIVYWTVNESEERTYSETFTFTAEEDVTIYPHFAAGMDLTVTNLEMNFDMGYDVVLIGTDNEYGLEFMIALGDDNGDGTYKVDPASMVLYEEEPQTVISGTITSIDVMNNEATVFLIGEIAGGLMAMNINMSLVASAAPVDVTVADATVTYNDNDGALRFNGTDAFSSDAVYVELSGFEYNGVGSNTLSVAQISMFENSTAFAFADEVVVTIESDGTVFVEGTYTSWADGSVYNVSIWGALPTYTLTLTSNPDEIGTVLTGAGTYYAAEEVTISASNEDAELVFAYWTLDEEVVSYDAEYTFRLGADMELVANYAMGGTVSDMTNLVIDTDTYADSYMAVLTGSDMMMNLDVMLAVSENIEGDLYKLGAAEVTFQGEYLDFVSGTVTIDMVAYTATANIIVSFGGQLMAITCNMSATASAPVDVMVADATVTYSDNDGALKFNGTDVYSNDAVYVELSGFEYNGVGENTLSVAQISMFENSTAFAFADEVVVTIESDGTVFVEGTYTSWADGSVYNVSIWGALPTYTLTLTSDVSDAVLTGAGTYYAAQEVTVIATPEPTGLVFDYWSDGAEKVSTSATYTFRLGKDLELVANYKPEEPEVTEITLTEGDNTTALETTGVVTVTVERDFIEGNLYTIALPFAINNVASVFGAGTVAYEYAALEEDGSDVVLQFKTTNTLVAGKPYLLKPANNVDGFTVNGVTLSSATTTLSYTVNGTTVAMVPVLSALASNNGKYWLAENTWLYNDNVAVPALRALFTISTTSGIAPRARVAMNENAETGLENINAATKAVKAIENGQLIITIDGVKYNVQGVRF